MPTLPPGPRSSLSQLAHASDPYPWMLAFARRYADPATTPILGGEPVVVTWSPEGAKAVFTADPATFASGAHEALGVVVGQGSLFLLSGERHHRARKLLAPPFHGERMRAWGSTMRAATLRWVERLPRNHTFRLVHTTQAIALDVIIEVVFGVRDEERVRRLHTAIVDLVASFGPFVAVKWLQREFWGLSPWARFQKRAWVLRGIFDELLAEKRRTPGDDVVSLLLSARDAAGDSLSPEEITEQLLSFVVAGHETTATTLAWAMDQLHRDPALLGRLRAELGSLGSASTPDEVAKLPLLDAVCNETLRLFPPVPMVTRRVVREFELGGYTLPPGTVVGVAGYMAHHREEVFPNASSFRPDRFVGTTYSPFEFMPFGGGARRCLGAAFAMYELKMVLATLLEAGTFELREPKPVGRAFRIGTFGPSTGIRMRLCAF
jgi:cytochrome P450